MIAQTTSFSSAGKKYVPQNTIYQNHPKYFLSFTRIIQIPKCSCTERTPIELEWAKLDIVTNESRLIRDSG